MVLPPMNSRMTASPGIKLGVRHLFGCEAFHGFEQRLDAFVADARVEKAGVVCKRLRLAAEVLSRR